MVKTKHDCLSAAFEAGYQVVEYDDQSGQSLAGANGFMPMEYSPYPPPPSPPPPSPPPPSPPPPSPPLPFQPMHPVPNSNGNMYESASQANNVDPSTNGAIVYNATTGVMHFTGTTYSADFLLTRGNIGHGVCEGKNQRLTNFVHGSNWWNNLNHSQCLNNALMKNNPNYVMVYKYAHDNSDCMIFNGLQANNYVAYSNDYIPGPGYTFTAGFYCIKRLISSCRAYDISATSLSSFLSTRKLSQLDGKFRLSTVSVRQVAL